MARDLWPVLAHHWSLLGPPLRPSPEDIEVIERVAHEQRVRSAVVLGVTPEVAGGRWPEGVNLTAVDLSSEMIAQVWPALRGTRALVGDWRKLPLGDATADLVTGDGALTVVRFPDDTRKVLAEARRVLVPRGHLVARVFVPPATREDPREITEDLRRGRIGSFHAFKWRLCMALAGEDVREGLKLGSVWAAWRALVPDAGDVMAQLGWREELTATIDTYRDSPVTYWFPSAAELMEVARHSFTLEESSTPRYELGERCPTLVLRAI